MKTTFRYLVAVLLLVLTCSTRMLADVTPVAWEDVHFDTHYASLDCGGQPVFAMLDTEHMLAQWVPVVVNKKLALTDGIYIIPETIQDGDGKTYTVVATTSVAGDASLSPLMLQGMTSLSSFTTVENVSLPKTLRHLGKESLYYIKVNSITLPASVEYMGEDCINTTTLDFTFEGAKAPDVNFAVNTNAAIHCPYEGMEEYTYQIVKKKNPDLSRNHTIIIGGEEGRSASIALDRMGNLSLQFIKQYGSLDAVNSLTVSGVINKNDWGTILTKMPNLVSVDLSGATTDNAEFKFEYGTFTNYSIRNLSLPKGIHSVVSLPLAKAERLIIPEGVTSIGKSSTDMLTLDGTLTHVSLPNSLEKVNNYTFNRNHAVIDKVPANLKYIGERAFYGCSFGEELVLPEGLEYIGNSAISSAGLTTISLPSTLRVAENCLTNNPDLRRVICHMGNPPEKKISSASMQNITLVVPAMSRQLYEQSEAWSQYAAIETFDYVPKTMYVLGANDIQLAGGNYPAMDLHFNDYNTVSNTTYGPVGTASSMVVTPAAPVNFKSFILDYSGTAMSTATKTTAQAMWRSTPLLVNGIASADEVAIRLYGLNRKVVAFTLPFNADIQQIVSDNPNLHISIYEHSGASRTDDMKRYTNTWTVKQSGMLKAGVGYFLLANDLTKEGKTDEVAVLIKAMDDDKKQKIFTTTDVSMPLELFKAEFPHNSNWNTLGNPYPCPFDTRFLSLSAPITVWDTKNAKFYTYSPLDDNYILTPGQFFYLQCPEEGSTIETFASEGRQINYDVRKLTAMAAATVPETSASASLDRSVWNVTLSNDAASDRTRIVFSPSATKAYDLGRDAVKFTSAEETEAQIYTISGSHALSINELPTADEPVMLGITVPVDGEYSLCLNTQNNDDIQPIILLDTSNGTQTAVTPGEEISLSLSAGSHNNRFYLCFGNTEITGITTVPSASTSEEPVFFTISGQRIPTPQRGIYIRNNRKHLKH